MLRVACIPLCTATIGEQEQFAIDSEAFGSIKDVFGAWCPFMLVKNKRFYALSDPICYFRYDILISSHVILIANVC